jgi:hypothetical protein
LYIPPALLARPREHHRGQRKEPSAPHPRLVGRASPSTNGAFETTPGARA